MNTYSRLNSTSEVSTTDDVRTLSSSTLSFIDLDIIKQEEPKITFDQTLLITSDEHRNMEDQQCKTFGLTVWEAGLAFVGSIIGGGIVGIPYSMYETGIPLAIVLNILVILLNLFSGQLYLRLMKMASINVESIYEISYVTIGKPAIYFTAITQFIALYGSMIVYYIVFGDICASIVIQLAFPNGEENFFTARYLYLAILGVASIPIIVRRRLAEIKIVSIILLIATALWIVFFSV